MKVAVGERYSGEPSILHSCGEFSLGCKYKSARLRSPANGRGLES